MTWFRSQGQGCESDKIKVDLGAHRGDPEQGVGERLPASGGQVVRYHIPPAAKIVLPEQKVYRVNSKAGITLPPRTVETPYW